VSRPDPAAAAELRDLYREFDRETDLVAPRCVASGRCCDFEAYGHTLFASRLEAEVLLDGAGPPPAGTDPALCPFYRERRCHAREGRPLACRAYFCDESKTDAMGDLHERFLRRLKDLHDRHGIPWRYAPLLGHLADLGAGTP